MLRKIVVFLSCAKIGTILPPAPCPSQIYHNRELLSQIAEITLANFI